MNTYAEVTISDRPGPWRSALSPRCTISPVAGPHLPQRSYCFVCQNTPLFFNAVDKTMIAVLGRFCVTDTFHVCWYNIVCWNSFWRKSSNFRTNNVCGCVPEFILTMQCIQWAVITTFPCDEHIYAVVFDGLTCRESIWTVTGGLGTAGGFTYLSVLHVCV